MTIEIDSSKLLADTIPLSFFTSVQTRFNNVWDGGTTEWAYRFSFNNEKTPPRLGARILIYESAADIYSKVMTIGDLSIGYTTYQPYTYTFYAKIVAANKFILRRAQTLFCNCVKDEFNDSSRISFGPQVTFTSTPLPTPGNENINNTSTCASIIKFSLMLNEESWITSLSALVQSVEFNGSLITSSYVAPTDDYSLFNSVHEMNTEDASTYSSGKLAYVASLRDYFFLERTVNTGSTDAIEHVAAFGGGVWHRLGVGGSYWATRKNWYINTDNGNDENVGSIDSPLKTFDELSRRLFDKNNISDSYSITVSGTDSLIAIKGITMNFAGGDVDITSTDNTNLSSDEVIVRGRGELSLNSLTFNQEITVSSDQASTITLSGSLINGTSFIVEDCKRIILDNVSTISSTIAFLNSNTTFTNSSIESTELYINDKSSIDVSGLTDDNSCSINVVGTDVTIEYNETTHPITPITINNGIEQLVEWDQLPFTDYTTNVNITPKV